MMGGDSGEPLMAPAFDPRKQKFAGSYAGSMTPHLWVYEGSLDETGEHLTLDCEGPSFEDDSQMTKYQDIYRFDGADRRTLSPRFLAKSGEWKPVMTLQYRRTV